MVALLDVVRDNASKTPSLIFEYVNNTDFRSLYPKFVDFDVRYYIFELLKVYFQEGLVIAGILLTEVVGTGFLP